VSKLGRDFVSEVDGLVGDEAILVGAGREGGREGVVGE